MFVSVDCSMVVILVGVFRPLINPSKRPNVTVPSFHSTLSCSDGRYTPVLFFFLIGGYVDGLTLDDGHDGALLDGRRALETVGVDSTEELSL